MCKINDNCWITANFALFIRKVYEWWWAKFDVGLLICKPRSSRAPGTVRFLFSKVKNMVYSGSLACYIKNAFPVLYTGVPIHLSSQPHHAIPTQRRCSLFRIKGRCHAFVSCHLFPILQHFCAAMEYWSVFFVILVRSGPWHDAEAIIFTSKQNVMQQHIYYIKFALQFADMQIPELVNTFNQQVQSHA